LKPSASANENLFLKSQKSVYVMSPRRPSAVNAVISALNI